jgi:hypothetical protein
MSRRATRKRAEIAYPGRMDTAAAIVLLLLLLVPIVIVGALFVWGAIKDGQEDKAVQKRLGIRRKTRLGR